MVLLCDHFVSRQYLVFADEERIGAKRKKKVQHFGNFFGDGGGAGFGGGTGGGGGMGNFFSKSTSYMH